MMDRYNPDRDNSPSGRPLHTYTPRSHEDLLKSHLQLDVTRNARLQNELHRLQDENRRLRRVLDNAQKDIRDKGDEIDDLKKKLRRIQEDFTQERPSIREDPNKVFEIDGKPVTLDQILDHFDGVIQKHHYLLNRKNQQIEDLEEALRNRPKQEHKVSRNFETQTPRDDKNEKDFAKELALIRKEYEQVENLLTQRNNKLENLIEDLRRKLDQYADEIGRLRKELESRGLDQNESTVRLLKEKEKENDYLKDLINQLQRQQQNIILANTTNKDLENEIKRIIEDKKNAVIKLSNMIIELKKTPSGNVKYPDTSDVEKECKAMMGDLNNMNDKLNNILQKLKDTPQTAQGEPINKDDLMSNLNNLKKQCENQIDDLKNQLKSPTNGPSVPEPIKPNEPIRYRDPSPESSLKSYKPIDYRSVTPPEVSYRYLPKTYQEPKIEPIQRLYPEIPSETRSLPPKPRQHSPFSCEACQDDYITPRDKSPKFQEPPSVKPAKPKKKGCCGKKQSDMSNVPYQKHPDKEEVIYIHHPDSSHHKKLKKSKSDHSPKKDTPKDSPKPSPKPQRKLIGKLKIDKKRHD